MLAGRGAYWPVDQRNCDLTTAKSNWTTQRFARKSDGVERSQFHRVRSAPVGPHNLPHKTRQASSKGRRGLRGKSFVWSP